MSRRKRKITGAIFDLDGTLLDSMPMWEHVAEEYLIKQGIHPTEDLNKIFKTMSLQESALYYQEHYAINKSVEEIIRGVNDLIKEAYEKNIAPKDGVITLLSFLHSRGVKMCIATATDREIIEPALQRIEIKSYFNSILTCSEVGSSKEAPKIYEEALHRLETKKESTIVFEDAYHAIQTAKRAGFIVAAVEDKAESKNIERIKTIADYYIKSLSEMECYIDEESVDDCRL